MAEVRLIVSKYNLENVKQYYDFEEGLRTIKYYQSSFGNVMPKTKSATVRSSTNYYNTEWF